MIIIPNWVFNSLVVSGDKVSLDKLKEQLNQPVTKHFPDHKFNQETKEWEDTPATQQYSNPVFSFWNVVAPTDLDAYYGRYKTEIDSDNILGSIAEGFALGMDSYNWNVRNWGTKWDVAVQDGTEFASTTLEENEDGSIMYRFETAWSPVPEVLDELARMYPELDFDYEFEEEQGWGGSILWEGGEVTREDSYDIPMSHADYHNLGRECLCEYSDIEDAFQDCPVDETKYQWVDEQWVALDKGGVEV